MPVRIPSSSVLWYRAEPLTHMPVTILTPLPLVSNCGFSRSFIHSVLATQAPTSLLDWSRLCARQGATAIIAIDCDSASKPLMLRQSGPITLHIPAVLTAPEDMIMVKYASDD